MRRRTRELRRLHDELTAERARMADALSRLQLVDYVEHAGRVGTLERTLFALPPAEKALVSRWRSEEDNL